MWNSIVFDHSNAYVGFNYSYFSLLEKTKNATENYKKALHAFEKKNFAGIQKQLTEFTKNKNKTQKN